MIHASRMTLRQKVKIITFSLLSQVVVACPAPVLAEPVSLAVTQGIVFIDQGGGFEEAAGLVTLNSGNRVMLQPGSTASLSFSSGGCTIPLSDARVWIIPKVSPCNAQVDSATTRAAQVASAPQTPGTAPNPPPVADVGGVPTAGDALPTNGGETGGASSASAGAGGVATPVLIGGAVVAAAGGIAILASSSKSKSASP